MKNINLKGVTAEAVTGVLVLLVALVNAVLQMFGINTLPIENGEVSEIVSTVFLIATTLYNVYKNRNITVASQKAQQVTDAIKAGEILVEDAEKEESMKKEYQGNSMIDLVIYLDHNLLIQCYGKIYKIND